MVSTLYQERLIAEEYLFTLTHNLHEMSEHIRKEDSAVQNVEIKAILNDIHTTNDAYRKTKLIQVEGSKFDEFERLIAQFPEKNKRQTDCLKALKNCPQISKRII